MARRISFGLLVVFGLVALTTCNPRPKREKLIGGISDDERPADDKIRSLLTTANVASAIKTKILAQSNSASTPESLTLTPLAYRTQLVAGTNYFVKVRVTNGNSSEIWWVRIYEVVWQKKVEVTSVTGPKPESQAVGYF